MERACRAGGGTFIATWTIDGCRSAFSPRPRNGQPAPCNGRGGDLSSDAGGRGKNSVAVNIFLRKLRHGARLTEDDESVLAGLASPALQSEAHGDILGDGAEPRSVVLILDGWACCYKHLENGTRQIISLLLPGDLCEPFGAAPPAMTYAVGALTPVSFSRIPRKALRDAW